MIFRACPLSERALGLSGLRACPLSESFQTEPVPYWITTTRVTPVLAQRIWEEFSEPVPYQRESLSLVLGTISALVWDPRQSEDRIWRK